MRRHPCQRAKAHAPCDGIEPGALAGRTGIVGQAFHVDLGKRLFAPAVVVLDRIVQRLALFLGQAHAGADAVRAPAVFAVVREQPRIELGITGAADRAGAPGREHLQGADVGGCSAGPHGLAQSAQVAQHMHHALAMLECTRQHLAQQGLALRRDVQADHRQFDGVFLEPVDTRKIRGWQEVAVDAQMGEAAWPGPVGQFGIDPFAVDHQWRQQSHVLAAKGLHQLRRNAVRRLRRNGRAVMDAMLHPQLDVEQAQEMPDLGGGANRRLAPATRQSLLDRHRRRNAIHRVHLRPSGRLHDAARIRVERLQIAPLAFVEQDVEGESRLAGATDAGDYIEFIARNCHRQRLQVVLLGIDDADGVVAAGPRHGRFGRRQWARLLRRVRAQSDTGVVFTQRPTGMRCRMLAQVVRRAHCHQFAAGIAAFGSQVEQPVAGADHIQVVFDHQQRMPGIEQLAQGAHQLGDIVEMQAGGRLVEHEQVAMTGHRLTAAAAVARGLGQIPGQLEPLGLTARQGGHGLAELDVLQPHIHDRLQRSDHVTVLGKQGRGLADCQVQHVGHIHADKAACHRIGPAHQGRIGHQAGGVLRTSGNGTVGAAQRRQRGCNSGGTLALDTHFQHFGSITLAVAIGAAQVDVAEELHLHMLEPRATAGGAAPVAAVEAELGRGIAALARQRRIGKQLAQRVPRADITHRVGACGLADRRLVDKHHIGQQLGTEQAVVPARRLGGAAEMAHQRRRQHILHQRGFAGATDPSDADQTLQRNLDRHILQIMFTHAL